jgi:hypothetical protein
MNIILIIVWLFAIILGKCVENNKNDCEMNEECYWVNSVCIEDICLKFYNELKKNEVYGELLNGEIESEFCDNLGFCKVLFLLLIN